MKRIFVSRFHLDCRKTKDGCQFVDWSQDRGAPWQTNGRRRTWAQSRPWWLKSFHDQESALSCRFLFLAMSNSSQFVEQDCYRDQLVGKRLYLSLHTGKARGWQYANLMMWLGSCDNRSSSQSVALVWGPQISSRSSNPKRCVTQQSFWSASEVAWERGKSSSRFWV